MVERTNQSENTPLPPRQSDILFGPRENWQANVYFASGFDDIIYQDGYRQAALHLVEYVRENVEKEALLAFPIVYLYRHHIELTLKSIIKSTTILLDQSLLRDHITMLGQHDLSQLWGLARPLLEHAHRIAENSTFPQNDLEGIDSYIRQLHEHDPNGQCFRYPTSKKGEISLRSGLTPIDITQVSMALEKLADYLEGTDNWISDLIEAKQHTRQGIDCPTPDSTF